jgi:hypothetical protein
MNTKAGIFVGGETDFDVTFSESSEGVTSLSVANVGNNPAYSVTVRIPEQSNYRVSGSTSTIVGNLDKGDYTIVSFQISQSSSAAPSGMDFSQMTAKERAAMREAASQAMGSGNNLEVNIEYTDTTGIRHIIEKSVPIQFREAGSSTMTHTTGFGRQYGASSPYTTYMMYGVLAVLVVALLVGFRKREKIKPLLVKVLKRKKG